MQSHLYRRHLLIAAITAISFLYGCSGLKSYPNNHNKNLQIKTTTDSGSMFSSVKASLHIYSVNTNCEGSYQGTVKLDQPDKAVGIPENKTSYLAFDFDSSTFLGGSSSSISYETLLKPRPGYQYDIEVSYIDDLYNVIIKEMAPNKRSSREIDPIHLANCNKI
ncbi:MAG TPA: hypothetical protein VIQ03_11520 [Gammaproteobacteria bacterium]